MDHEVFHRPLSALSMQAPRFVAADIAVAEALALLQAREEPCVLVGSKTELVGILTERDLLLKAAGSDAEPSLREPVSKLMTPNPQTLPADATVRDALLLMASGGYRNVPIVEDGSVIGVLSVNALVDFLVIQFPAEILNPWFDIKPGDAYG